MLPFAFALLLSAAAPEGAVSENPAPAHVKPAKAKMVCRADDTSGSRVRAKICKTQQEWDSMRQGVRGDTATGR